MPNVLPTIPQEPAQGIQALLDTVYLWNPDVANGLIDKVNELLEELGDLTNLGAIKPYAELVAPVPQYLPMSYNDGVYVANEEMTSLPATPDLSKWTLIATKVDEQALEQQISRAVGGEADLRQQADTTLQGNIDAEERARIAADNNLQTQIDAISAASDVTDIVGTYQELENYDTSTLSDNDIIKVLQDETQEDATTYYRWVVAEDEFQLIGEEGPYYTRAQTDAMLEEKQDIMQFSTMPEADASNANKVIQYVGEDIPESRASAVATQTVGSGLTDLSVDLNTFVETEQPSGAETVAFVCTGLTLSLTDNPTTRSGITIAIDESVFFAKFAQLRPGVDIATARSIVINWYTNEGSSFIDVADISIDIDGSTSYFEEIYRTDPGLEIDKLSEWGVTITGTPEVFQWQGVNFAPVQSTAVWSKDGVEVDPADYGVTYSGTPAGGDTISVAYTPAVNPITSGYFYVNTPTYSEPVATIEQTVGGDSISFETTSGDTTISGDIQAFNNLLADIGWTPSDVPSTGTLVFTWYESDGAWFLELQPAGWGDYYAQEFLEQMGFVFTGTPADGDAITANYHFGLLDLSVDPDTFVEAEQPSGSETVSFVASVTPDSAYVEEQVDPAGWSYIFNAEQFSEKFLDVYGVSTAAIAEGANPCSVYYDGNNWSIAASGLSVLEGIGLAEWGITVVGTVPAWGMLRIRGIAGGASWAKNGATVDIAEYGITYDGTPANGDTITVNYTAPYITGYVWEQINVQPGGTGGIKWAGQWDKPASTTWTYYYPHYTFPTLPDGNYELTVQNKSLYQYSSGVQNWSHKTFKITFGVTDHRARGITAWVLDGNTDFYLYNMSSIPTFTHWSSYYEQTPSDRLDRIVADAIGACRIGNSTVRTSDVEGIFRWTNIKNTDTGEEIPVEINVLQNPTGYGNQIGSYNAGNPVDPPHIPTASYYFTDNCNNSRQYVYFGDSLLPLVNAVAQCGSFEIVLKDADGSEWRCVVENNMYSYVARVLKASGIFENTQLGWSEGDGIGNTCVFLNTPAGTNKAIEVWVTLYGNTVSANCWLVQSVSSFAPVLVTRPGSLVTADNFGLIEQYTGETDANYVNGYFYKATGTKVDVPESIAITTVTPVGEATVTIDLANWIDAVAATYGWGSETVRSWLTDYVHTIWNLSYNADNREVTRMYMPWYGDTHEQNILQYVTVDYTGSQEGEVWVEFQEQYTGAHTEVQNGHWDRIDVQPAPSGLPDQTGQSGKFLTTDGTDASWSDKPVLNISTDTNSGYITWANSTASYPTGFNVGSTWVGTTYNTSNSAFSVGVGMGTQTKNSSVAVGNSARAYDYSIAIGSSCSAYANYAIQLGKGATNSDANTFKVGNANGNFEIMSADGTIPADRLAHSINKYSTMPTASASNDGWIVQFTGTTDATYTHGYIYENVATTTSSSASATQTVGNSLSDLSVNVQTFQTEVAVYGEDMSVDHTYVFTYYDDSQNWMDPTIGGLDILAIGVTYTGTPVDGDEITIAYTAESTSYAWTQVDVQPAGATYTAGNGISIDSNNEISTQDIPAEALADTSGLTLDAGAPYALTATYSEDTQEVSMAYENVVTQVNGVSGNVWFDAQSIFAVPQWNPANEDPSYRQNSIIQSNATSGSYTEGYFYKSVPSATPQVATISGISSTGATNIAISNQATLDSWCEAWSGENEFSATIEYLDGSWQWQDSAQDFGSDLSALGITYDGTPDEGDQFSVDWPQREYEWQRIDVQPDSSTLTPNFNSVKFNGLSTLQSRDYYIDVRSLYYLRIGSSASQTVNDLLIRADSGVKTIAFSSSGGILGSATGKFARVYTEKLNNGADITVPTTGGTMAVQVSSLPTAGSTTEGQTYQYIGATDSTYTHGYIYENVATTTQASAIGTQTAGTGLTDITVNAEALASYMGWTTDNHIEIGYGENGWAVNPTLLGISFTGTPVLGDSIRVDYTAPVTTYSWTQVDVQPSSGGSYLPLSGGTMTGPLVLPGSSRNEAQLILGKTENTQVEMHIFAQSPDSIMFEPATNSTYYGSFLFKFGRGYSGTYPGSFSALNNRQPYTLGTSSNVWTTTYTRKLNYGGANGADIDVPQTSGTMVVATPPTTPNTTWVLKATVDANGDYTVAWVQES